MQDQNNQKANPILQTLITQAWNSGNIEYKLRPAQRVMRSRIYEWEGLTYLIKCARRLGKTYMLSSIAIEACLKRELTMVRYGAPTQKNLVKFIIPIMRHILTDCPSNIKFKFYASQFMFECQNTGSQIHLAGVNNYPDNLRGTEADLFILDEAGSINNLMYIIKDVALPQLLNQSGAVVKGRRLLLASSPAITPAHEFTQLARKCESQGNYSHFDIYHGGYPDFVIEQLKEESGGEDSSTWKREYLALDVVDEDRALIPEWRTEYECPIQTDEYFQFYLKYESIDTGIRDYTACLFAYYDFRKAILYIMDEIAIRGPEMTTERTALLIKEKEKLNFGNFPVSTRVSDIDLRFIQDMSQLHNLHFLAVEKGRLEEMVNRVRIWVNNKRIIVDPKCVHTVGCLRYGVWNEKRKDFDRCDTYGHYDALAALMYLVSNIDETHNPIPYHYGKKRDDIVLGLDYKSQEKEVLEKAFKLYR